jgi:hypothetical protein
MISNCQILKKAESPGIMLGEDAVSRAFRIEEVLNRAHEIHVARGGLFGYDLEDWLRAERELAGRTHADKIQTELTAQVEALP